MRSSDIPERNERRGAAMKYGCAHLRKSIGRALCARALADDEGMCNVRRVVDAETDADHEEDADEGINGLEEVQEFYSKLLNAQKVQLTKKITKSNNVPDSRSKGHR